MSIQTVLYPEPIQSLAVKNFNVKVANNPDYQYINVRKISKKAYYPYRASHGAAGLDLSIPDTLIIPAHTSVKVPLDLEIIPVNSITVYAYFAPRSSVGHTGVVLLSDIVENYGNLTLKLHNFRPDTVKFPAGFRIAQLIISQIIPFWPCFQVPAEFSKNNCEKYRMMPYEGAGALIKVQAEEGQQREPNQCVVTWAAGSSHCIPPSIPPGRAVYLEIYISRTVRCPPQTVTRISTDLILQGLLPCSYARASLS